MQVILKTLKKKAMSIHQIGELVEVKYATARAYLLELKQCNNVYIASYERTCGDFRPLFKFGNKEDAPKPERIPHWVYDMKRPSRAYKSRNKNYETNTKPRRDVAASWF
jgi:hypothetical protein